ncbi:MAG: TonB-dependent receptor plug domain-containing protein, partial [Myxococcota bacterium]
MKLIVDLLVWTCAAAWMIGSGAFALAQSPPHPSTESDSTGTSGDRSGAEQPEVASESATPIVVEPIDVALPGQPARGLSGLTSAQSESPAAARALDEPAFVTTVHIDDRVGETTSVAEVLSESMGVNVRSLGGLGGFSSVSVRGADSGHTAVFVDGVPLSRIASVTADLGRYSLDSLSELELYRGGVPAELGGAALGGALNLITAVGRPASGRPLTLSLGAGSFGARHLRARWRDSRDDGLAGFHLALGYAGSNGDFSYFNDNGTNLIQDDDTFVARDNNHYDQIDAVARYRTERGSLTIDAGSRTLIKVQGIPGTASVQSRSAELTTVSQLVDVAVRAPALFGSPRLFGLASGFVGGEWQAYRDLDNEVGLGAQDRRYRSISTGFAGRASIDGGPAQVISLGADGRVDHF